MRDQISYERNPFLQSCSVERLLKTTIEDERMVPSASRIDCLYYGNITEYARTRACTIPATRRTRMTIAPAPVTVAEGLCFPERFVEFLEGQLVVPREGGLPGNDAEREIVDSADRHEGSDRNSDSTLEHTMAT